jgi:threonyl-tRNA synthetase
MPTSVSRCAVKLSPAPDKRVGSDDDVGQGRECAAAALTASGLAWEELPGEGAFYGPKIEFHIKDAIGRSWQCGTVQVDFSMPGASAPNTSARTTAAIRR